MNKIKYIISMIFISFLLISCTNNVNNTTTTNNIINLKEYNIKLDPNGGELENNNIKIKENEQLNLPIPIKDNIEFLGWFTGYNDNDIEITNETKISKDYNLYARWKTYKITYLNYNGDIFDIVSAKSNDIAPRPNKIPNMPSNNTNKINLFLKWDFDYNIKINKDYTIKPIFNENIDIISNKYNIGPSFQNDAVENEDVIFYDDMFLDSYTFNGYLALFSYFASYKNSSSQTINRFLNDYGFIPSNYNYDIDLSDNAAYTIANKKLKDETNLIILTIRGFGYGKEWADNFNIGNSGNHTGFDREANKIYETLKDYLKNFNNYKLLITGYSRAGAISNVLASKIIEANELIDNKKLFVYTFESPKGVVGESIRKYRNVYNLINNSDLVTYLAPSKYGFARCGIDINYNIYTTDSILRDYNMEFYIPKFKSQFLRYSNEAGLINYFLNNLTLYNSIDIYSLSTRNNYYNNYQDTITYLVELLYVNQDRLFNAISSLSKYDNYLDLLKGDVLYNELNPYFNDLDDYDDDKFNKACNDILNLINYPLSFLILDLISNNESYLKTIYMHSPAYNYILLSYYLENNGYICEK